MKSLRSHSPPQTVAMQPISTSNGPCQGATQRNARAGGSDGKYRAYTLLIAVKCAASVQYTLHLTTFSNDDPAAARHAFICSSTISVCRSMGKRLISPVTGS